MALKGKDCKYEAEECREVKGMKARGEERKES